jgi:periplasmic protein CpxP/Spy
MNLYNSPLLRKAPRRVRADDSSIINTGGSPTEDKAMNSTNMNRSRPAVQRLALGVGAAVMAMTLVACGHAPGRGDAGSRDGMGMGMGMGGSSMMGMHHGGHAMTDADRQQHRQRMLERATKELQLDATQQQRLGTLLDLWHAQRQAVMQVDQGKSPAEQLQGLMAGDRFDRAAAQALADGRSEAMKKGSAGLIAAAGDFFDSLKPEQQVKVREFLARTGQRGGHHRRGGRD